LGKVCHMISPLILQKLILLHQQVNRRHSFCLLYKIALEQSKTFFMKKKYLPEKKTGIWIDQNDAFLIRLENDKAPVVQQIKSNVESRVRVKGEGKISARFGDSFIDDQEKKQRRQRNERKKYFEEIINQVHNDDYLLLFGPGKGKEELNNAIEKTKGVKAKVIGIETTDRLSDNQMLKKTIDYFESADFREVKKKLLEQKRVASENTPVFR
jgi:hypothetical protein